MKLAMLYEYLSVTPAPYLDPKGKAKAKDDYSILAEPDDRERIANWGHKKKKKKDKKK